MSRPSPQGTSLGIDFGTSRTIAVVRRLDGSVRPLLFDGAPLMPSAVCADGEGNLLVGNDALHSGRRRPERIEPNPKRHIDGGSVLLGENEFSVIDLIAAVLRTVADECRRVVGAPGEVTVTVPAEWGPARRQVIEDAAARAGLGRVRLVPEPVAAATYFAETLKNHIAVGSCLVVYDLGAGTFDASVVRRTPHGFETVALDGRGDLGGLDIDAALVDHLAETYGDHAEWRRLTNPGTVEDRRSFREFHDEIRAAKERLSRHQQSDIAIPLLGVEAHLTRTELERLAAPHLERTIHLTRAVIRAAGLDDTGAGVFLVGGASRMPLVATMLHRALGTAPTVLDQPEVVVAEGSVLWTEPPRPPAGYAPRRPSPPQGTLASAPPPGPVTPQAFPRRPGPMDQSQHASLPPQPGSPAGADQTPAPEARRNGRRIVAGIVAVNLLIVAALILAFRLDFGSAGDDDVGTVQTVDEAEVFDQIGQDIDAHDGEVTAAAVSESDGEPVLFTAGQDGMIKEWDAESGDLIDEADVSASIRAMAPVTSSEGRAMIVAIDGGAGVHAWGPGEFDVQSADNDADDTTELQRMAVINADEHAAVAVMTDTAYAVADLESGDNIGEHELTDEQRNAYANFASVGGDIRLVTADADGLLRLYDAATGEQVEGTFGPGEGTSHPIGTVGGLSVFDHDGAAHALLWDKDAQEYQWWDLERREYAGTLSDAPGPESRVMPEAVEVEGTLTTTLYGGSLDGAHFYDPFDGRLVGDLDERDESTTSVATGELDGYRIAVTGTDAGTVRLWSLGRP